MCWPLYATLYNLPPWLCIHLNKQLPLGVIPGPHKPKDMNLFLVPMRNKFWKLAHGVPAFNAARRHEAFLLHAYLIRAFGNMPAIAKLMAIKGHNGYLPCRACSIHGMLHGTTYYTPLHRPGQKSLDPSNLPLCFHNKIMCQAEEVEAASKLDEKKCLAKKYRINGVAVLSTLSSKSMADSFPLDLMHLIPLNVIKNLVLMWTGKFKRTNTGKENYQLPPTVLEAIGEVCAAAGSTTPSVFGARVSNIHCDYTHFTAKTWTLFAIMLGPVLLHNCFSHCVFYDHFVELVCIFNVCLWISVSKDYVENNL